MTPRFTDKVMVVTGAAQGIGRRVAELAADEGARLVLVDIADYVQGVAGELRDQGVEVLAVQANLETWEGAERVMAQAHEQYGRIDILINNVGGTIWAQPFEHYQPEQIQKEIQRSLFPTLWCCRAVLPYMVEQKGGAIVNVSSVATRGLMRVPYGAAKGGVNAMTVNLAFEYAEHGIRVNAVGPGSIKTRMLETVMTNRAAKERILSRTPIGRFGEPEEVAEVCAFLASRASSYVSGEIIYIDGARRAMNYTCAVDPAQLE